MYSVCTVHMCIVHFINEFLGRNYQPVGFYVNVYTIYMLLKYDPDDKLKEVDI